jgi:hypothetical protein
VTTRPLGATGVDISVIGQGTFFSTSRSGAKDLSAIDRQFRR